MIRLHGNKAAPRIHCGECGKILTAETGNAVWKEGDQGGQWHHGPIAFLCLDCDDRTDRSTSWLRLDVFLYTLLRNVEYQPETAEANHKVLSTLRGPR